MSMKKHLAALAAENLAALAAPRGAEPPAGSRTAAGGLMHYSAELKEAKKRLEAFEGAFPTRKLDPASVRPSTLANRIEESFATPEFQAFKQEIASAGGNVEPIKVRPAADGGYEIVFGHRRHRACAELGLPVLATIHEGLSDQELFAEMERENRARADLSSYEQALHYERALKAGIFPNQRTLAAAIGVEEGMVSQYLALATLPKYIIEAFPSPLTIQLKWAAAIRAVHKGDSAALKEVALRLARERGQHAAKAVFLALVGRSTRRTVSVEPLVAGDRTVGTWSGGRGKVVIELDRAAVSDRQLGKLRVFLVGLTSDEA